MIELDDFVAPPARPGFREDVIREGELQRRAAARRRGFAVLACAGLLVASFSTAGVFALEAGGTPRLIDRTVSCPVPVQGGVPVFHLAAAARGKIRNEKGALIDLYAQLSVYVEQTMQQYVYYEGVTNAKKGYSTSIDPHCTKAQQVVLAPSGLPKEGVYLRNEPGLGGDYGYRCLSGAKITIRMRANISTAGAPTSARLIVRTGKKLRPVAYIAWTPDKVTTYLTPDCAPSQ
jgi:hypothetical protein